ncbi:uncharacterized [Tachysurus ichikawai]
MCMCVCQSGQRDATRALHGGRGSPRCHCEVREQSMQDLSSMSTAATFQKRGSVHKTVGMLSRGVGMEGPHKREKNEEEKGRGDRRRSEPAGLTFGK